MTKSGQTLTFSYDYLGRRIRTVTGTNASDTKFLWSGWTLAAEVSAANGYTVNRTFVWGPDFSQAQGNAGGAGSLLAQIDATTGVGYAITDSFGTAVGYFAGSGTTATLKLALEYTAYGKVIAGYTASGVSLAQYPIGYHGHYMDWETGLAYYGRRYYQPKHGRFINRDPIDEAGGNNLYAFVNNTPVNGWDVLGLDAFDNLYRSGDPGNDGCRTYVHDDGRVEVRCPNEGPSSGYTLEHQLNHWGSLFIATPSYITRGSWNSPLSPEQRRTAPNKEQQKKECAGLASIIGTFQGEAQKALNQFNSQLAYSQRLGASFSKDNFAFVRDARGFFKDFGGDIGFGLGAGVIGGQFAGLGNELLDAYQSAGDPEALSPALESLGHVAVGVYVFSNEIRPSIYRSRGFETVAGRVLPVYLAGKIGIKAYEHFGATVYNEWQQAGIMEQNNQATSQLMGNYLQQNNLVKQFQQQYKDKGCDKILGK